MIIKLNNDRSGEYVWVAFKNDSASSITQWTPFCMQTGVNSLDGIAAIHPATGNFGAFGGIARATKAKNAYGLGVAYGLVTSILYSNEGTSITVTAGDLLLLVTGTGLGMSSIGGATFDWANAKYAIAGSTITVSASGYLNNCFVKAL